MTRRLIYRTGLVMALMFLVGLGVVASGLAADPVHLAGKKERAADRKDKGTEKKARPKEEGKKHKPATEATQAPAKKDKDDAKKPSPGTDQSKKDATKDAAKPEATPSDAAKPATYKVKKRPMKIEVTLDGVFEAASATEGALHTQEWSDFEVLKAIEHGARVNRGDVLVTLDMERIDRAIAELQREVRLSQLALADTELQLQTLTAMMPLDAAASDRSKRISDEDLDRFLKVDRPLSERIVNFMVKMAEDHLAYEQEELRQLEKMYKADDLTEETEEIILKRARDDVERARFSLERAKIERESILKQSLPRIEESMRLGVQRQAIDARRTKAALPFAQRKLELTLEKLKQEAARNELRLKRLTSDRAAMTIKAPAAGIVYYGKCVRGKWSGGDSVAEKLRRGGRLSNNDVFLTIVDARPLAVRVAVPEKQVQHVTAGLKGVAYPAAFPDLRLTAIVQRVSGVPLPSGGFDTSITVALDEQAAAIMPGMTCEVKLVPFRKEDALAVPAAAVGSDETDGRKFRVALPGKDGKPERREVTIGRRTDKLVEILKGLSEGDEILAEYPKE